jgi:hypothetical protein
MLDLSAAYDVVNHTILLERLNYSFGISDSALSWIESYLKDRSQRVAIGTVVMYTQKSGFCGMLGSVCRLQSVVQTVGVYVVFRF